ncbi:single-stranded DNA-binding protein [Streptomyces sp. NBRC 14336]|uniref:single-stranded DNA-binding protein n=1 Tax=Streptomyces sp. NBRC 14336 TaxID=3030992 RepID=UPI00249FABC1|nr:single-stranded DNA-binding protein [Streptomyces sp. NBRC 14336]GLW44463.1 single-stranded DNA-binding protein [Streptomyces sp. NBRC 14336]
MSVGETPITIVGNLAADPELRFTTGGDAIARFSVASTPRTYDKATGQWRDGTAMFLRCTAWRDLANHVAESLTKGTRVVVTGRLRQHNWQNEQGENRSMLALEVDDISPSLRFATAKVERVQRNGAASGAATDAWSTAAASAAGAAKSSGSGFSYEPPF